MIIFLFILSGFVVAPWLSDIKTMLTVVGESQSTLGIVLIGVCYTLLLAIPFVPAFELGILIMILFGKSGCVLAYMCTLAGFSLSYFIGWLIYRHNGHPQIFSGAKQYRTQLMFEKLAQNRSGVWLQRCCPRFLREHRYFSIAMLINLPGNVVIGGGGGIAMFCGAHRHIQFNKYFLTLVIAISPVPLSMLLGIRLVS
jgi:hypothetical protein